MMPNSDPEGQTFLSGPNNHDRFFFYMMTSAILKVDVVCDVAMTSTPNFLTIELRDLLYNQCIDNTWCYSIFIYPTGRIRVCKIRFVSAGENRGKPRLVCKKVISAHTAVVSLTQSSQTETMYTKF